MQKLIAVPKVRVDELVRQAREDSPRKGNPSAPGRKTPILKGLTIIPAATVDEVLAKALVRMPTPIKWEEPPDEPARAAKDGVDDHEGVVAH